MLVDTDVLIEFRRGNPAALKALEGARDCSISLQSAMEFFQGARHARELKALKEFLADYDFDILPMTDNIGHRALIYVEEYALSHGLRAGDALVAATAVENARPLLSANVKHFRAIKELDLHVFKPSH